MIAVFDPVARYALIVGLAVGTGFGCWLHDRLWWIVMYKAWVNRHEARRRKRLRQGPLWRLVSAYRDLFRDIGRLWRTGRWT